MVLPVVALAFGAPVLVGGCGLVIGSTPNPAPIAPARFNEITNNSGYAPGPLSTPLTALPHVPIQSYYPDLFK